MSNEYSEGAARAIAQDFLDRHGAAAISGDLDEIVRWCDLPCTLESRGQRVVLTDVAMVRSVSESFIVQVRNKRLTHVIRRCLEAGFRDKDTVMATYETRYVRDDQLLSEEPYVSFVILRRRGERWKFSNMQFDVGVDSPAGAALSDWNRS
ncbi:hypothetical protein [Microbulbifer sp. S227A]|uniref:hypothetical protein n=1 Tax=Microbulbifer sp. S227A TaxID=3415131 RepID=UPI003C7CCB8B